MSLTQIINYDTAGNFTFDNSKIEIVGALAQLKLISLAGQTFNQPFTSGTGFTVDATKTEFFSNKNFDDGTAAANYSSSIDLSWGDGVLTGTGTGAPVVSGGKLDLKGPGVKYVDYVGASNADSIQEGAIRFKLTPNYTGSPAADKIFVNISKAASDTFNEIFIEHVAAGNVNVMIRDLAGNIIFYQNIGAYSPTTGVEDEFELNWDLNYGRTRLFINGNQLGSTQIFQGNRDSAIGLLRVGSDVTGADTSDFEIDDLLIFNKVQHTANYTPGYTVNDTNVVTSQVVRQINKTPSTAMSWATYTTDINLNSSDFLGSLTGTPSGGAAVLSNQLDLAHSDLRFVAYSGTGNVDGLLQFGAVKFKLTPNYTTTPAADQTFFTIHKAVADNSNLVQINHTTGGNLDLRVFDSAAVAIVSSTAGTWNPTSGVTYEFELNFDVTTGATRIFIDGTQLGATDVSTGTRDENIGVYCIGTNAPQTRISNFFIEDFIVFDSVQHTANYTAGYTLPEAKYVEDLISLPIFTHPLAGDILSYTAYATTQIGVARSNVNGNYWNGAAWVASDDSYAQMNSAADINTNISSLTAANTVTIKMRTTDNNSLESVDDLTVTYTGQTYPTDDPSIITNSFIPMDALEGFIETVSSLPSGSSIQHIIQASGTDNYWNGAAWVVSDGTYAQSNLATVVETNKAALNLAAGFNVKIKTFLHSDVGLITPTITTLTIDYNFFVSPSPTSICIVYGWVLDSVGDGISGATVDVDPEPPFNYSANLIGISKSTTTDSAGYWELELVETASKGQKVKFHITNGSPALDITYSNVTIPNLTTRAFNLISTKGVEA